VGEQVCNGCGSDLQTADEMLPGYVTSSALENGNQLCRRCFRIRNYGEFSSVSMGPEMYEAQVARIADRPGVVLYVLDVFDLAGSLIQNIAKYVSGSRVLLVVNKVDLLPREVHYESLREWVRHEVQKTGVTVEQVLFVSANNGEGISEILGVLAALATSPLYVVGMANVGKSTLLNQILAKTGAEPTFTASRVPGTTLALVSANILLSSGDTVEVVDTPGLITGGRAIDKLCPDCLKLTVPRHRLRPRVFQLNAGQSLWLGGYVRFDFESGPRQSVVCYVSNELPIHRTKLERAEQIGLSHADDILRIPCEECQAQFLPKAAHSFALNRKTRHRIHGNELFNLAKGADIVLAGLGWITLFNSEFAGTLHAPDSVQVSMRPRLIGDLSRSKRSEAPVRKS